MRIQTLQVFDQFITGTSTTFYSGSQYNDVIGRADFFSIQAYATSVAAGSTLSVTTEISIDSENWIMGNLIGPEINGANIVSTPAVAGYYYPYGGAVGLPAHARLAINLGGSTPSCRLKLYVTLRSRAQ
jgi:hypothetical protein